MFEFYYVCNVDQETTNYGLEQWIFMPFQDQFDVSVGLESLGKTDHKLG
jgi:hypothetical protein